MRASATSTKWRNWNCCQSAPDVTPSPTVGRSARRRTDTSTKTPIPMAQRAAPPRALRMQMTAGHPRYGHRGWGYRSGLVVVRVNSTALSSCRPVGEGRNEEECLEIIPEPLNHCHHHGAMPSQTCVADLGHARRVIQIYVPF